MKPTSRDFLARHFDGPAIIAVRQRAIFLLRHIDELAQQEIAEHERDRERRKDDRESPGREMAARLVAGPDRGGRLAAFLFHHIPAFIFQTLYFRLYISVMGGVNAAVATGFTSASILLD
jgi:hypothetical protein